jgi:hypothetical protein
LQLVAATRARLRDQQELSIDELCDLIKRIEANRSVDMTSPEVLTRKLINEWTTPEEERAWATWWAEHPQDAAEAREFIQERKALMEEARQLLQQAAEPGSPAAQALLSRHDELIFSKYHLPERNRRQRAWNEAATRKWMSLGIKMAHLADPELEDYWGEVVKQSPSIQAFWRLMSEVRELLKSQQDPAAPQFDAPVARLREICAINRLGDALLYVEWRRFIGAIYAPQAKHDLFEPEWEFMERAVRNRRVE